ncbi:hypothetical protein, partial [Cupriavidus neocaledonicus]|uniref:hypothetical protein n=1 Tax=Cupriavidus neocaledonicus TaxID=1040979 RepID=UPI001953CEE1
MALAAMQGGNCGVPASLQPQIMNHGAAADKLVLVVVFVGEDFSASSNYFVESLANPVALAYYSPPRNTTRRCKSGVARVAG